MSSSLHPLLGKLRSEQYGYEYRFLSYWLELEADLFFYYPKEDPLLIRFQTGRILEQKISIIGLMSRTK